MWKCPNCGNPVRVGVVCEGCARPFDPAATQIGQKVRRLGVVKDVYAIWFWRGAKVGFLVGVILSSVFTMIVIGHSLLSGQRKLPNIEDLIAFTVLFCAVTSVLILPLTFAAAAVSYGLFIKPVLVALFCSVERFEQEYGSLEIERRTKRG